MIWLKFSNRVLILSCLTGHTVHGMCTYVYPECATHEMCINLLWTIISGLYGRQIVSYSLPYLYVRCTLHAYSWIPCILTYFIAVFLNTVGCSQGNKLKSTCICIRILQEGFLLPFFLRSSFTYEQVRLMYRYSAGICTYGIRLP